ncbi:helix-turn-helix domain-containing protein [Asaccharospora irregularis]|uniref:Helix-turn-helix n=1 Tax=Asaccharospora irregularis DSM 2635 TaxID=1121321 RepID=A0A1M5JKI6_9FIRM|nr:helix-turn-helix transcriptional regulator [Asaccharospora irregularis]SHG41041.1 Helix-turn-helix [Asaccharospora irregularis DSM 2635]
MTNNIFQQVGNNIQDVLREKGITQQYLADTLNISKQVMSKIVVGAKAINVSEVYKIASILEVSVERLLDVKEEEPEKHNFSFMGKVENEKTKEKIEILKTIIDEIIMLEEYANV